MPSDINDSWSTRLLSRLNSGGFQVLQRHSSKQLIYCTVLCSETWPTIRIHPTYLDAHLYQISIWHQYNLNKTKPCPPTLADQTLSHRSESETPDHHLRSLDHHQETSAPIAHPVEVETSSLRPPDLQRNESENGNKHLVPLRMHAASKTSQISSTTPAQNG